MIEQAAPFSHTQDEKRGVSRPYRLAALNSHPSQYFAPMYRRLAADPRIDLTVFYCSRQGVDAYVDKDFGKKIQWDIPLLEGYRYKILPNLWRTDKVGGFTSLINPSMVRELREGKFDALWLHGYFYATSWLAIITAKLLGIPLFYRSESSLVFDSSVRRPWYVRFVKPRMLRFLFRQVHSFLAIGKLNREFYLHYGARPQQLFHVPYSVDNEYFAGKVNEARADRDARRAELGIAPDDITFLFAAKITPQKSPMAMLEAYHLLGDRPGKALIFAGDGELRAAAETYVRDKGLKGVHFMGFVNQSKLPMFYAMSDVFVRPDGIYLGDWGLTVNEAMASSLAVISSDGIGATVDLVKDGVNGRVVRFGDIEHLAAAMRFMCDNPQACREMGRRSFEMIADWSYEKCLEGTLEALRSLDNKTGYDTNRRYRMWSLGT